MLHCSTGCSALFDGCVEDIVLATGCSTLLPVLSARLLGSLPPYGAERIMAAAVFDRTGRLSLDECMEAVNLQENYYKDVPGSLKTPGGL